MPLTITNQDRRIMRDVTVCTLSNLPAGGGAAGTAVSYLGVIETVEIQLKREYTDTTASGDLGSAGRAIRWGLGSVKLTGFSAATGSLFASLFVQGGHAMFNFTEVASGDVYQLVCRCEDFSKSLGKDATKDTLTFPQEGIPYYAAAGGVPSAIPLE